MLNRSFPFATLRVRMKVREIYMKLNRSFASLRMKCREIYMKFPDISIICCVNPNR